MFLFLPLTVIYIVDIKVPILNVIKLLLSLELNNYEVNSPSYEFSIVWFFTCLNLDLCICNNQ